MIDWRVVRQFRAAPGDFITVMALVAWAMTAQSITETLILLVLAKLFINDVNRAERDSKQHCEQRETK